MRILKVLLLATLGASGAWRAPAVVVPPATNGVVLAWNSLGPGTRYYVQTSTNMLKWTTATNTSATNASLTLTGDKTRGFRLWASNAPPQRVKFAWEPGASSTYVVGYFIYYGQSPRSYTSRVDAGLATSGVVSNLVAGTTYYFAATAYTASGSESDFSNEAVWQSVLGLAIQWLP
jgi:hypothetical protein